MKKSEIKKILVISLSNLGDIVLTFPVIDILKRDFSESSVSVVVGPKGKSLLEDNPTLDQVIVFDKHAGALKNFSWIRNLRKERFDFVVDLRNTAIPLFLLPRYKTPLIGLFPISGTASGRSIREGRPIIDFLRSVIKAKVNNSAKLKDIHMKDKHLKRLKSVYDFDCESDEHYALHISDDEKNFARDIIKRHTNGNQGFVVISPSAADSKKRWLEGGFAKISDILIETHGFKVLFVGDQNDDEITKNILRRMTNHAVNLCAGTTLKQLAAILSFAEFTIANDSAVAHLSSYLNKPTLVLFGPTDPKKYGPWSKESYAIRKEDGLMSSITVEDVLAVIRKSTYIKD